MTFHNAGTLQVEAHTYLFDDYSSTAYDTGTYQGATGTTKISGGATLASTAGEGDTKLYFAGGNLYTIGSGTAFISGDSDLVDVSIRLNQATAGGFGSLSAHGLLLRGATTFYCDIDGASDDCDTINATSITIYDVAQKRR